MKSFLLLVLVCILTSCQSEKEVKFHKMILGEWNYTTNPNYPQDKSNLPNGFNFINDSICENKAGFIERKAFEVTRFENKTKYTIDDDSLKIYNPITKKWITYQIVSITNDSLILKNKHFVSKYYKANYNLDKNESYDAIVLVYSTSPVSRNPHMDSYLVYNNGVVYYSHYDFREDNYSFYKTQIEVEEYKDLEQNFKKSSINKLNEKYIDGVHDGDSYSLGFIKNNHVYKTIYIYGESPSHELSWAYTPLKYWNLKLKMTPEETKIPMDLFFDIRTQTAYCKLSMAEQFYLKCLLQQSSVTTQDSKDEYFLTTHKPIKTDGRYYKIDNQNYDIGFNFLTNNQLEKRFKPIKKAPEEALY